MNEASTERGDVTVLVRDHVAVVTLDRPRRRNALSRYMRAALADAIAAVDADDEIRVAILTGAGAVFCSGGDVREMPDSATVRSQGAARNHILHQGARMMENLFALRKPLIAALNGPVVGMGCALALAADIRLACSETAFDLAFVRRGLVPDGGTSYLLARCIGVPRAASAILCGARIGAEAALAMGLVQSVSEQDSLLAEAERLGQQIARNAPLAVQAAKRLMQFRDSGALASSVYAESEEQARLLQSEDFREGKTAFLEHREPAFRGT
jgi:enoyl-CoA hydratase/carnithine racemase